ncbi:uncharacterized protein LOC135935367 [Cloeon dipterum]|uniref:uncharacterized protein LOC135935367 n=1 Tax=Cloeon dipterum TaxID=197152 RepID=UPI0032200F34
MTWGLASSSGTNMRPTFGRISDRGQDFSYSSPGWSSGPSGPSSGWKSGWKGSRGASNAAVSALALLSFLFFLNMLQQNLSSGQQQTLLFSTNTSGRNRFNRRVRRPVIAVAQLKNDAVELKTRPNAKFLVRKTRQINPFAQNEEPESREPLEDIGPTDPPPPVMMEGLAQGGALQLGAWLQGKLSADQLRTDLLDTLTNCRAVVACALHTNDNDQKMPAGQLKKLLGEAGEFAADTSEDNLKQVCRDLTLAAGDECSALALSFAGLLPSTERATKDSADEL